MLSLRRLPFGTRLVVVVGALLVLFGVAVLLGGLRATRLYLEEVDQSLHLELAEHLVAEEPLLRGGEIQASALEHVFHMLMVINPRIECYLLDPDGRILAYDAPPGRVVLERVELGPVQRYLARGGVGRLPLRGTDPRSVEQKKIFSAAPVAAEDGGLQGYLYVVLSGEQYSSVSERLQRSAVLRFAAATAVAAGLLTLVAAALLVRHQTRRLRRLDERMQQFRRGGSDGLEVAFANDAAARAGDEIDRLTETFDQMTGRIHRQVDQIQESDRIRRELVANVSHDLRTPVASLQGYLETLLLKRDALDESERREYLEVAHAQSERLGRLVTELFELARLDAGDARLEREAFSVAELAQDVVQKFRLRARDAGIELNLEFADESVATLRVFADLRLIERVLENLIENALRHTGPSGRVVLHLEPKAGAVEIAVRDTGCGIPEEELPHIFDRFYRVRVSTASAEASQEGTVTDVPAERLVAPPDGSASREASSAALLRTGSGLGLSIAQRVVEMHESQLWVRSRQGSGSVFGFQLATA